MRILPILFCLCCQMLSAQDLHIFYNLQSDSFYFESRGKILKRPIVKKGSQIWVHVTGWNNYLYEIEIEETEENYAPGEGPGLEGAIPAGGPGMEDEFPLLPFMRLPGPGNMGLLADRIEASQSGSFGFAGDAAGSEMALSRQLRALEASEMRMADLQTAIQSNLERIDLQCMAARELDHLKSMPNLTPEFLQGLAEKYLQTLFQISDPTAVDLAALSRQNDPLYQLERQASLLDAERTKHQLEMDKTLQLAGEDSWAGEVKQALTLSEKADELTGQNLQEITEFLGALEETEVPSRAWLWTELLDLLQNKFQYDYRLPADADVTLLDLQIRTKPAEEGEAGKLIHRDRIRVESYGGWKVNGSVGLGFGQFMEPSASYFVQNGILDSEQEGSFTPLLTSFIHLHHQPRNTMAIGASLGIGLPVGDADAAGPTFLLGPSLFLGKQDRAILTLGMMGGKQERLANGLEVGLAFDAGTDGTIPLKSRYELGFFLGFSFNLMKP